MQDKKKQELDYEIIEDVTHKVYKNGKFVCSGVIGLVSALEAIFVVEKLTKKDWLIYRDDKVYLINRVDKKYFGEEDEKTVQTW